MGDPISIATGTVGIVSFGIQISSGLIKYCKAWKAHDKTVEAALESLTTLNSTLQSLDTVLSSLNTREVDLSDSFHEARDKVHACVDNLNRLRSTLMELESISEPAGILDKIHNVRLRSIALFNKEKFKGLRTSIENTQLKLESAILILQLRLAVRQTRKVEEGVEQITSVQKATAEQISKTIEQTLLERFELYGRGLEMLRQDVLNTSSEHINGIKELKHGISTLQLGMIQKPSLLQSVVSEHQRTQVQRIDKNRRLSQRCTCRASSAYETLYPGWPEQRRSWWKVATFSSVQVHHRKCPLFHECRVKKQIGFRLSYCGPLLQGAMQVAMSTKRGSGGSSVHPMLAFSKIVPSNTGPFKVLGIDGFREYSSAADLRLKIEIKKQELLRLYQQDAASPYDVNEEGDSIIHIAIETFITKCHGSYINLDISDIYEMCFQFIRDLNDFGVPLNTTNAAGLTPLYYLFMQYSEEYENRSQGSLTQINLKLLELGAELPVLTSRRPGESISIVFVVVQEITKFPELAEACGCNEIGQAVIAQDKAWLTRAIKCLPELIDQPNLYGQTPLHLSVYWPEGAQLLVGAGANVNAIDNSGFTPIFYAATLHQLGGFDILAEEDCLLFYQSPRGKPVSLLEYVVIEAYLPTKAYHRNEASEEVIAAVFENTVKLVAKRMQALEALRRAYIDAKATENLHQTDKTISESNLCEEINVPASLSHLSLEGASVYHIPHLTLQQAQVLWDAGFHQVDLLNDRGLSPMMLLNDYYRFSDWCHRWELMAWFIKQGADTLRRQEYTLYSAEVTVLKARQYKNASSTTASHYLAHLWGLGLWFLRNPFLFGPWSNSLSEQSRRLQSHILSEKTPDCCDCACSTGGCVAYTIAAKCYSPFISLIPLYRGLSERRDEERHMTQVLAQYVDIEQPNLAWLRREVLRFNTFERLELSHTCCEGPPLWADGYRNHAICERYDRDEVAEINEEQREQLDKLESLLIEFNKKYEELGCTFCEFLDGYWTDRMNEIESEEHPIDHTALQNMGVVLKRTTSASSLPSYGTNDMYAEEWPFDDDDGGQVEVEVEEVEEEEENDENARHFDDEW